MSLYTKSLGRIQNSTMALNIIDATRKQLCSRHMVWRTKTQIAFKPWLRMTRHAGHMEIGCCYAPVPESLDGIHFKRVVLHLERLHPHLGTSVFGKEKGGRNR